MAAIKMLLCSAFVLSCTRASMLEELFEHGVADDDVEIIRQKRNAASYGRALVASMFNDGDEDRDNRLTPSEFWAIFSHFDGNGDGAITQREHTNFFMTRPELSAISASGFLSRMASRQFRAGDKNNDGVLTSADADIIFDNLDMNVDGFVSKREFFSRFHTVLS